MTSNLDLDRDTMVRYGTRIAELVADHIATLRNQPAQHSISRAEATRLIASPPPEKGSDLEQILNTLQERVFPYHAREPHPHFMGYIPSSPTFPAILGDWLASGYNFFAGVWSVASGPNEIELVVLDWFRQWLGMPAGTSGLLTSGGSAATLTAVVAARHAADPSGDMVSRLTLYTSEQAHSSAQRAAWIAGIPRTNVRAIDTDDDFRMHVDALREAVATDRAAGLVPFMVVASAGTTNTGAVDPLAKIADLCEREQLWMHVDAAYAGFAALTSSGTKTLAGIDRADSVTLDPHKWLFVPFECGCLLARDPRKLEEAFSIHPEYLTDVRRPRARGELRRPRANSSRARRTRSRSGLSITYFGVGEIREAIARGIRRAEYAARRSSERDRTSRCCRRRSSASSVFGPRPAGVESLELDSLNERINARVNGTGRFLISSTRLRGKFSLQTLHAGAPDDRGRHRRSDIGGVRGPRR